MLAARQVKRLSIAERKEREKEQRRKDIADAAEELFFDRGYDNVTMDDIAKRVELNKATIYLYFKDKESLYFTVVLRGMRIMDEMVREREGKAKTGFDKLWEIGHGYVSFAKKYPDYTRAYNYFYSGRFNLDNVAHPDELFNNLPGMMDSGPKFWKNADMAANRASNEVALQIFEINRGIFELMCNAIRAGVKEGKFRQNLDPVEAATVFTLLLESLPRMRPDLVVKLESQGIDRMNFARDIGDFMGFMLAGTAKVKK
jgi:TetR/AcrR family transcriptional regulator